jgi:hypothetical protein
MPEDRRAATPFFLGVLHVLDGHPEAALAPCQRSLKLFEALPPLPDSSDRAASGAGIQACLGNHAEALRLAQRAVDLDARDALSRPQSEINLALTEQFVGNHQAALEVLERSAAQPNGITPGELQTPWWDSVRQDPRFQKLLATANTPIQ